MGVAPSYFRLVSPMWLSPLNLLAVTPWPPSLPPSYRPNLHLLTPNMVVATRPLADWFWLASTDSSYGGVTRLVPVYSAIPLHQQCLNLWAQQTRSNALAKLGASGPGLTNTAFQQGMHEL